MIDNQFTNKLKHWIRITLGISSLFQVLFFFSWPNLFAIISTLLAWLIYDKVSFNYKQFFLFCEN